MLSPVVVVLFLVALCPFQFWQLLYLAEQGRTDGFASCSVCLVHVLPSITLAGVQPGALSC